MSKIDITLYGILDPERSLGRDLAKLADAAVRGGCTVLQLRDKHGTTRQMLSRASSIMAAIDGRVPFLINDRVDVAMAVGADGVHVGQDDMPVENVRALMGGDAIIGLSIKTENDATSFAPDMLDYVCIGGVFDTQSKDNPTSIGISGWQDLAALCRGRMQANQPIGAIAGIDVARAVELTKAGADGVALISALFMKSDVTQAARAFRSAIDEARKS